MCNLIVHIVCYYHISNWSWTSPAYVVGVAKPVTMGRFSAIFLVVSVNIINCLLKKYTKTIIPVKMRSHCSSNLQDFKLTTLYRHWNTILVFQSYLIIIFSYGGYVMTLAKWHFCQNDPTYAQIIRPVPHTC